MKKITLLVLGMMSVANLSATNITTSTNKIGVNYRYDDAVTFVERGIEFHVFLNGDFDFDTHSDEPRYEDYYGRRTRVDCGVRIERDYDGRVRRVGNTFINYDVRGNVKRIGSVYMRYRFGQLIEIGNMEISYDRYGYPHFYGNVKYDDYYRDNYYENTGFSIDISIGDVCDYNDVYFYQKGFNDNYRKFNEDDNFFYYRAVPNAKIGKRSKVLKRRKPADNVKRQYRGYNKKQERATRSKTRRTTTSTRKTTPEKRRNYSLEPRKDNTNKTPTRSRRL